MIRGTSSLTACLIKIRTSKLPMNKLLIRLFKMFSMDLMVWSWPMGKLAVERLTRYLEVDLHLIIYMETKGMENCIMNVGLFPDVLVTSSITSPTTLIKHSFE